MFKEKVNARMDGRTTDHDISSSSTVPPVSDSISDSIKADECNKANLRNFFFTGQALVDGSQKNLPANNQRFTGTPLSSISIMQAEVLDV